MCADKCVNFREFFTQELLDLANDPEKEKEFLRYLDEYFDSRMPSFQETGGTTMKSEHEGILEHIYNLPINEKLNVALHIIMHANAEFIENFHELWMYDDEAWEDLNDGINSFQTVETQIYNLNGTYVKYLLQKKYEQPEDV